ncbi:hypothetical protein Hanom_Chr11g01000631 [Helianthus anomalus]
MLNKKGKKSESEFHSVRNLLRESWELAFFLNFLQVPEEMSYDLDTPEAKGACSISLLHQL